MRLVLAKPLLGPDGVEEQHRSWPRLAADLP